MTSHEHSFFKYVNDWICTLEAIQNSCVNHVQYLAAYRQVRALRIDDDDRKEANLESAGAPPGTAVWEEEVFIAQLHRRAQLLNQVRQLSFDCPIVDCQLTNNKSRARRWLQADSGSILATIYRFCVCGGFLSRI